MTDFDGPRAPAMRYHTEMPNNRPIQAMTHSYMQSDGDVNKRIASIYDDLADKP